ncbi:MAG: MFS transporter [Bifidobacteriaceae bacterium]|nr:MFS transporter [Bifidobacteriaceae bacterium]
MRSTFASLAVRNFRLRFFGGILGNTGTWMQRVAQDWLVLTALTAESGLAVGIVTALQFGPALVLSPWAGLAADRLDRRKLLMATQSAQAVLALALGALVLADAARLWHVYVLATALGAVTAFDGPANQTFVGQLVPARLLTNAVALNSASFNVARLLGPAAAGLLVEAVGAGWVFLINAASFAGTIGALALIRVGELRRLPSAPARKGQIREGVRYVARRTDIVVIMVVIGVVSCLGLNSQITMAVMARQVFHRQADGFGLLASAFAVGARAGSLLAARRERPRVRLVIGAAIAFGVLSGVSALSPSYLFYAVSGAAVGMATLTLITAANATLQLGTAPALRGRIMSLYNVVFLGSTPLGAPFIGWVAQAWGPRWSIGIGAIASVLVGVGAAIWAKARWRVQMRLITLLPPHLAITNPASDDPPPSDGQPPSDGPGPR